MIAMNVSSITVRTAPEHLWKVIDTINSLENCEVHFYDSEGRIIATVEGERISDQMESMKQIQNMPFVLNASLMYSYCEDELKRSIKAIEDA